MNKLINWESANLKGFEKYGKTNRCYPEGLKKLEEELEYLKTTARSDVAEKIKIARGFGDLSENSEYDEAKNEQAKIEARITDLEVMLKDVKVISENEITNDKVMLGVSVSVRNMQTGKDMEFRIVGTAEADASSGKISDESPVGKALIGHTVGEVVVAEAPRGDMEFTILGIKR